MATPSYKSFAEVCEAYSLQIFPVKGKPNKFTASFTDSSGKRRFLDRKAIEKADGSTKWSWAVGKVLTPAETTVETIKVA